MFGLITGMGIMTGQTTPSLLTVDVEKMKVVFTIPEIGQLCSISGLGDLFVMTPETEIIFSWIIVIIEFLWEKAHQETAELRAMDIVTLGTGPSLYGTVQIFTAIDLIGQIDMTDPTEFDSLTL